MVEFINALTGTLMLVPDERKEEYLAAGHKLAASAPAPAAVKEPVKRKGKVIVR